MTVYRVELSWKRGVWQSIDFETTNREEAIEVITDYVYTDLEEGNICPSYRLVEVTHIGEGI